MSAPVSHTKIAWMQQDIRDVMNYFVKGFKPQDGQGKIVHHQYFIDTEKQVVLFKLFVDEPTNTNLQRQ